MSKTPKRRGVRYRFTTSMLTGLLSALLLAWFGTTHGRTRSVPPGPVFLGAVTLAIAFGLVMFTAWSVIAMFRRASARAAERARQAERESRGSGRGRRRMAGVR